MYAIKQKINPLTVYSARGDFVIERIIKIINNPFL